jgi:hypothetical protein
MTTQSLAPIPVIDIRLSSGLFLRDSARKLVEKFQQWPWDRYDGIPVKDTNRISDEDIEVSFSGLGARSPINRDKYKGQFRDAAERISEFLRAIPDDVAIEDERFMQVNLQESVIGLFDCLTNLEGVKLANASKAVCRHRKLLFPVLDSFVRDYYWFACSIRDEKRFRELQSLFSSGKINGKYGKYVFALLELFREDLCAAKEEIDRVREVVREYPFSEATRARILESMIWYYYARR